MTRGIPCFDPTTDTAAPGTPCATLLPIDLTRGGSLFTFRGHADVKEISLYVQDTITKGNWSFNLGIRGDMYQRALVGQPGGAAAGNRVQHQADATRCCGFRTRGRWRRRSTKT